MVWLTLIITVWAIEQVAQPFLSPAETWEFALGAKYLSLAAGLQLALSLAGPERLLFRSILALFCIGAWVDVLGHTAWQVYAFDSTLPVLLIWTAWFIPTLKKPYSFQSTPVRSGNVYIMLLRPRSTWAVCKSLIGFPVASVCLYANGSVWSFRAFTGTFDLYPANERWLRGHIAIDTGYTYTEEIQGVLDNLVGQRRGPGIKCVWVIRKVLKKLGYALRWCDYIPGIFAQRLLKGRG